MRPAFIFEVLLGILVTGHVLLPAQPRAFEIGPAQLDQLPKGKEADGIIGDFVLKNDVVIATISHNAWDRRANMSTFSGVDGITPGCLYDLTFVADPNDQITIFAPCGQKGPVSWVRVAKDGADGEAMIETVTTAPGNKGLLKRHAYSLRDGWQGVLVTTTLINDSAEPVKVATEDRWTTFLKTGQAEKFKWADAVDPADHAGFAVADVPNEITLQPREERKIERFLALGHSPAEAVGVLLKRDKRASEVMLSVKEETGKPVPTARVLVPLFGASDRVPAYPDAAGRVALALPAGAHEISVADHGRETLTRPLAVKEGQPLEDNAVFGPQCAIAFNITGPDGAPTPCKVNFAPLGQDGQPLALEASRKKLDLGPSNRAHGCLDQWHSEKGAFRVPLPPGKYRVVVTRGIEFSHLRKEIDLPPGATVEFSGQLQRLVDTRGWLSTDFHNHSTPSGDNTCGTDDRIINLAAEHIEFAPTTEHNRLYDWAPHIKKLGLEAHLSTIPGIELTGSAEHLNSFPLTPEPGKQDNGAPKWNPDARISAITLRHWQKLEPDRWIQVNHPNLEQCFVDWNKDGVVDGGYVGIGQFVDGWEIENFTDEGLFGTAPYKIAMTTGSKIVKSVRYQREFIWLQLLNQGMRLRCVAVADAHTVHGNGVGGWRTYLPSATDDPAKADWRELSRAAKAGRSFVTTGPFLDVTASAGGQHSLPGGDLVAPRGEFSLRVRIQCTDWLDVDRVQIFVNSRQPAEYNFTRASHPDWFGASVVKFDRAIPVKLSQDAHVIVVAVGEHHDLKACYGTSAQGTLRPIAYQNPIYVDVDGNGWTPNKDTLGHDLPIANLTVERVSQLLGIPPAK
ncbi:MAG: CehA/McbA family metallohydrolase [Verrucomicrobiales bacterium]